MRTPRERAITATKEAARNLMYLVWGILLGMQGGLSRGLWVTVLIVTIAVRLALWLATATEEDP